MKVFCQCRKPDYGCGLVLNFYTTKIIVYTKPHPLSYFFASTGYGAYQKALAGAAQTMSSLYKPLAVNSDPCRNLNSSKKIRPPWSGIVQLRSCQQYQLSGSGQQQYFAQATFGKLYPIIPGHTIKLFAEEAKT
jgi:hypothetical protein